MCGVGLGERNGGARSVIAVANDRKSGLHTSANAMLGSFLLTLGTQYRRPRRSSSPLRSSNPPRRSSRLSRSSLYHA